MGTTATLDLLRDRQTRLKPRTGGNSGNPPDNTAKAIVLRAARRLTQPFCLERLIVAAWKEDTLRFGLRGFESVYPDANAVGVTLSGKYGLVTRGHLIRVGPKLYRLPFPTENVS